MLSVKCFLGSQDNDPVGQGLKTSRVGLFKGGCLLPVESCFHATQWQNSPRLHWCRIKALGSSLLCTILEHTCMHVHTLTLSFSLRHTQTPITSSRYPHSIQRVPTQLLPTKTSSREGAIFPALTWFPLVSATGSAPALGCVCMLVGWLVFVCLPKPQGREFFSSHNF